MGDAVAPESSSSRRATTCTPRSTAPAPPPGSSSIAVPLRAVRREVWSAMTASTPKGRPVPTSRSSTPQRVLTRGSFTESTRIAEILRKETVGGALLLLGALVALVWINSPAGDSYTALRDYAFGPESLHLDLSLGTWAADGLLAIFFFVVGLELKREFVAGDLRDPARAALPILAALGGVAV